MDAIKKHDHRQNPTTWTSGGGEGGIHYHSSKRAESCNFKTFENENGKNETRPKNFAVYYYIKIN